MNNFACQQHNDPYRMHLILFRIQVPAPTRFRNRSPKSPRGVAKEAIFQGLAISLMAGDVASLLLSRMTVPMLYLNDAETRGENLSPSPLPRLRLCHNVIAREWNDRGNLIRI